MYQQLRGAQGREIYFRAPRLDVAWLGGGKPTQVTIDGIPGVLCNMSLGGMLVDMPATVLAADIDHEVAVEVRVDGDVVYLGCGIPVRREQHASKVRLGVRLTGADADPVRVRSRIRDSLGRRSVALGTSVYDAAPVGYRSAVLNAVLMLQHWRRLLCDREHEITEECGSADPAAQLGNLELLALEKVRVEWARAREAAAEASSAIDRSDFKSMRASKLLTEAVLTPLLSEGLIWRHAYMKPRGYPGDYELMNIMYDRVPRGDSVFARIIHRLGCEERLAATVPARRRFLTGALRESLTAADSKGGSDFRIANLGAGPAGELADLIVEGPRFSRRLVITLIDQDAGALEFADRTLRRACFEASAECDLKLRHVSFRDLLKDKNLLAEMAEQDCVYSAGFFDYLPDGVASGLLCQLASLLRSRGRLLVGNAMDLRGAEWVPEFVLDWHMIYRTGEQMLDLSKASEGLVGIELLCDESRTWQFLSARKGD